MQTKFATAALLGFVLIAVAACSGGDDGLSQAQEEALQQELAEQKKAAEEAEAARKAAEEKAAREEAARKEAEKEAADAAQAERDAAAAETAREAAEAEAAEAEAARKAAEADAEKVRQQLTEAQRAERTARATAYFTALNAPDARSGGSAPIVSYVRDESLIVYPGSDMRPGTGAPSVSGFTAHSFVAGDAKAYMYTNVARAGTREFWKIYGLDIGTGDDDFEVEDATVTGQPREVGASTTQDTEDDMVTYGGSYHGVSGTWSCAGLTDACTIVAPTADSVGNPTFTGTWRFKPSPTAGVKMEHDTEYLYFGVWLVEPDNVAGSHSFAFLTGGNNPRPETSFNSSGLSGTYRFQGRAVGKYAMRNQANQADQVGTFTAQAELTAVLGTDHPVTAQRNTLTGLISNFQDGSDSLGDDWEVVLDRTGITSNAVTAGTVSGEIGGLNVAGGAWAATLHGSDNAAPVLGDATAVDRNKYPLSRYPEADLAGVVGHFYARDNASSENANISVGGAFGATPRN